MVRVADYIIEKLVSIQVSHIFMVTGRGIIFLTDAVAKCEGIEGISVQHEQSGAFAAYAYAQRKGTFGACMVSTGVGATNAITGVLNAWQDDVPVIFISGQHMLKETSYHTGLNVRTFGQQEANIVEIVKPITKYAVMVEDKENVAYEIEKAIHIALTGRKGPVWIDIPLDIQNARIELDEVRHFNELTETLFVPSEDDMLYVRSALNKAKRPIVLFGSGIRSANCETELITFLENYNIPAVFDSAAVDVYADENKLSIGTIGSLGGSRVGNFALQNADLVLIIGCRMTSMQVGEEPNKFAREADIIWIDIDENEIKKKTINPDKFILSDAKEFLNALISLLDKDEISINSREWVEKCSYWKNVFPKCEDWCRKSEKTDLYYLAECIGNFAISGQTITCDAGIEELVIPPGVCKKNGVRCIHPASQGCMGFALGASIGAYYASMQPVISVIGDGSIMMNLQELQTIKYQNLPIKIFVANNNCYAVIRKRQQELFRTRTIGTDKENGINCADFEKIAYAFGIPYKRIENSANLEADIKQILSNQDSFICEVMTLENQEYIRNAVTRNEKGRFVKRYLEDQAPFMDRELFYKEMIVEPIGE